MTKTPSKPPPETPAKTPGWGIALFGIFTSKKKNPETKKSSPPSAVRTMQRLSLESNTEQEDSKPAATTNGTAVQQYQQLPPTSPWQSREMNHQASAGDRTSAIARGFESSGPFSYYNGITERHSLAAATTTTLSTKTTDETRRHTLAHKRKTPRKYSYRRPSHAAYKQPAESSKQFFEKQRELLRRYRNSTPKKPSEMRVIMERLPAGRTRMSLPPLPSTLALPSTEGAAGERSDSEQPQTKRRRTEAESAEVELFARRRRRESDVADSVTISWSDDPFSWPSLEGPSDGTINANGDFSMFAMDQVHTATQDRPKDQEDYPEGRLTDQKRLASEQEAQKFRAGVQRRKQQYDAEARAKQDALDEAGDGWGNLFAQYSHMWNCEACFAPNPPEKNVCLACDTKKGEGGDKDKKPKATGEEASKSTAQTSTAAKSPAHVAPGGFGVGGFSLTTPAAPTAAAATIFGFAGAPAASTSGFSFVSSTGAPAASATAPSTTGFSYTAAAPSSAFGFGTAPAPNADAPAPVTGFPFGNSATAPSDVPAPAPSAVPLEAPAPAAPAASLPGSVPFSFSSAPSTRISLLDESSQKKKKRRGDDNDEDGRDVKEEATKPALTFEKAEEKKGSEEKKDDTPQPSFTFGGTQPQNKRTKEDSTPGAPAPVFPFSSTTTSAPSSGNENADLGPSAAPVSFVFGQTGPAPAPTEAFMTTAASGIGAPSTGSTSTAASVAPLFGSSNTASSGASVSLPSAPSFGTSLTNPAPFPGAASSQRFGASGDFASPAPAAFGAPGPAAFGAPGPAAFFAPAPSSSASFGTFAAPSPGTGSFGAGPAAAPSGFGSSAAPAPMGVSTSSFGTGGAAPSGFGSSAAHVPAFPSAPSTFGSTAAAPGFATGSSGFGSTAPPAPPFGASAPGGFASTAASGFGSNAAPGPGFVTNPPAVPGFAPSASFAGPAPQVGSLSGDFQIGQAGAGRRKILRARRPQRR